MYRKFWIVLFVFLIFSIGLGSSFQLRVTEEHPFLINNEWIQASELKVGDMLQTIDGKSAKIINLFDVEEDKPFEVYNLEAEPYHDFVVISMNNEKSICTESLGIIVHNSNLGIIRDPNVLKNIDDFEGYVMFPTKRFWNAPQIEHITTRIDTLEKIEKISTPSPEDSNILWFKSVYYQGRHYFFNVERQVSIFDPPIHIHHPDMFRFLIKGNEPLVHPKGLNFEIIDDVFSDGKDIFGFQWQYNVLSDETTVQMASHITRVQAEIMQVKSGAGVSGHAERSRYLESIFEREKETFSINVNEYLRSIDTAERVRPDVIYEETYGSIAIDPRRENMFDYDKLSLNSRLLEDKVVGVEWMLVGN